MAKTSAPKQISFQQELIRKTFHLGALIVPASYYLLGLSKLQMLAMMIPVFLGMFIIDVSRLRNWWLWRVICSKFIGQLIRRHERKGDFIGATYILLSTCCTIALYSMPIAVAALSFIIVGDAFAAIIGRKFGRHWFGRKSLEGSLACLAGTIIVAVCAPELPFAVALIGAATATIVEAFSVKVDDNITVPIASGLIMTIFNKIFTNL